MRIYLTAYKIEFQKISNIDQTSAFQSIGLDMDCFERIEPSVKINNVY